MLDDVLKEVSLNEDEEISEELAAEFGDGLEEGEEESDE